MSPDHGDRRPIVDYRIDECDDPRADDVSFLRDRLVEFNRQFLGADAREPLGIFARDAEGAIVAGLTGVVSRGWLHVDLLWVAPEMRGAGLGRELLGRAERRAGERTCAGVLVETYDFQALSFYEANGYERFATLDGYPVGSRQHYLAKRL